ncbi:MAG: hypothetical protein IKE92_06845 [Clostridiales bacterium]|nr:hypothetical protein [Clostridiales bacterium]MBR3248003.1 hypothetical protein [Clostridiales bacterium]
MKKHINSKIVSAFLSCFIVLSSISGLIYADEVSSFDDEQLGSSVQDSFDLTSGGDDLLIDDESGSEIGDLWNSSHNNDEDSDGAAVIGSDNELSGDISLDHEEDENGGVDSLSEADRITNDFNSRTDEDDTAIVQETLPLDQAQGNFEIISEEKLVTPDECPILNPCMGLSSNSSGYYRYSFTGVDSKTYNSLKKQIGDVAYGRRTSTKLVVTFDELGVGGNLTAADLGVSTLVKDGKLTTEAKQAIANRVTSNVDNLLYTLLVDLPFDLYWYDKTEGLLVSRYGCNYEYLNGEYVVYLLGDGVNGIAYSFSVSTDYAADDFEVKSTKVTAAKQAAANAQAIVDKYASLSDTQKLTKYKEEICKLVSYNDYAASGGYNYGDPWQMVYVFDGNSNTNVVCEGYAKAFKYLCDLTTFASSEITCIIVTGDFRGSSGAGGHMWNVVSLGNNTNYLVDVTNCDTGSVGADDLLFIRNATTANSTYSYSFKCNSSTVTYIYDDEMSSLLYRDAALIITTTALVQAPKMTMKRVATGLQLDWSTVKGATRYKVYRKAPTGGWTALKETTSLTFTDPIPATDITTYSYCVRGISEDGKFLNALEDSVSTESLALAITEQPVNYTGASGSTASFSLTAQGTGLTYQWQVYSNGAWTNSNATGSKSSKITFKVTDDHNGKKYRCIVKDEKNETVTSNVVSVTIGTPPTITKQPMNYSGAAGSTATFSVTASGTGLKYQWQIYSDGTWRNSGATGSKTNTISFKVTNDHNGMKYRCVVTNSYGIKAITNAVSVSILNPPKITKQPANFVGAVGSTATFSVTASGSGLTYQWQLYNGTWKNSGATGSKTNSISFKVTNDHNGMKYRCIITDKNGLKTTSDAVSIRIVTPPSITKQPTNYVGAAGSTATFGVTASGSGLNYQWQLYSDGTWRNSGANGAKTSKISFTITNDHNGKKYRCVITDSNGLKVISNVVSVKVVVPPTITKQPVNYSGRVGSTASFSLTASGSGLKYQWQMYSDGTWKNSGATGSKTNTINFKVTNDHNGKKYRCVITDSNGLKVTSNVVSVKVV